MVELTYSEMCNRLCGEFGSVSFWPIISPTRPRLFNRSRRKLERRVCAALGLEEITNDMRAKFWHQVNEGQGYTDATGYRLRCWQAMLGLRYLPAEISFSTIRGNKELLIKYGFLEEL